MKVAFFTEMGFVGKISRSHPNMRTEFAWMHALDAIHFPLNGIKEGSMFDLGIVITPKNKPEIVDIPELKKHCKKIAIMQEGPHWFYQDYEIGNQFKYLYNLHEADIILCHNGIDKKYYQGLIGNNANVEVMPTLMIESFGKEGLKPAPYKKGIIQGGNFCSWYGGVDSYIVAQNVGFDKVHLPTMGRKKTNEETIEGLIHLPYMQWDNWILHLNDFKYGIHLMRTHAAGTFPLNCAYLGTPCIGYEGLDTQEKCHPTLTVSVGDLEEARILLERLKNDKGFYNRCSQEAKQNYKKYYHEDIFNNTFKKQLEVLVMGLPSNP